MAEKGMHQHHVEAAIREGQPVGVAGMEGDAVGATLLCRKAAGDAEQDLADVHGRDRRSRRKAVRERTGDKRGAAAKVKHLLGAGQVEPCQVIFADASEKRAPATRFEACGSGGQHPPVGAAGVSPGGGQPPCHLTAGCLGLYDGSPAA